MKPPHSRDDDNNRAITLGIHIFQHPNIKCQGQAQLLFIDDAPKKSTVAISFGIVSRCRGSGRWGCMLQHLKFEFPPWHLMEGSPRIVAHALLDGATVVLTRRRHDR